MKRNFLAVNPDDDIEILKGLASPVRIQILKVLHGNGAMNVNDIAHALALPQSTIANNISLLEESGLIRTEAVKAKKGQQKICSALYDEIVIRFDKLESQEAANVIEVNMPLGLYTSCEVSAPCGLCDHDGIIGLLDVPDYFLNPDRMRAELLWFGRGYVEYKFPNNAKVLSAGIEALEISLELSSEVPGTNVNWPSDITVWINGVDIGTWTSPGDYGDKRGVYTPQWWKLAGSQYGALKTWNVSSRGTYIDGVKVSDVNLDGINISDYHSIKVRIGIGNDVTHPGGVNIFGKGFGNYDQDILLRLYTKRQLSPA